LKRGTGRNLFSKRQRDAAPLKQIYFIREKFAHKQKNDKFLYFLKFLKRGTGRNLFSKRQRDAAPLKQIYFIREKFAHKQKTINFSIS